MSTHRIYHQQKLPISLEQAWEFFSNPRNLEKLTPKDVGFKILSSSHDQMEEGQIIVYKIKVFPLVWVNWVTEITHVKERQFFVDDQRSGPYKLWHHRHSFAAIEGGVKMTDEVHYMMPFGFVGSIAHALFVRKKLRKIFSYRAQVLEGLFGSY